MDRTQWHDWVTLDEDQYVAACADLPDPSSNNQPSPSH